MNITEEHHIWFRETGAFLEPAGDMDSPKTLAFLERYSQSVREDLDEDSKARIEEAADVARDEEKSAAKEAMDEFKESIIRIVDESDDALEKIRKLCE